MEGEPSLDFKTDQRFEELKCKIKAQGTLNRLKHQFTDMRLFFFLFWGGGSVGSPIPGPIPGSQLRNDALVVLEGL